MKAVLISIQPKWCELIALGKKTVEVRKTKPKLETPFKCYIYCTKGETIYHPRDIFGNKALNGKVIGEFVCSCMTGLKADNMVQAYYNNTKETCLTDEEIKKYANGKKLYYWHISDLVIYDKPRELGEFKYHCRYEFDDDFKHCDGCGYHHFSNTPSSGREEWCGCDGLKRLERPPQSWCYVEVQDGT